MKRSHPNEDGNDESVLDGNDDINKQFQSNESNQHRRIVNEEYDENSLQKEAQNTPEDLVPDNQQVQDDGQNQQETDKNEYKSPGKCEEAENNKELQQQLKEQPDQQGVQNSVQDLNVDNIENNTASLPQKEAEINQNAIEAPRNEISQESQFESLMQQYINEINLIKIAELCNNQKDIYQEFKKLKYKNKIYSINDLVLIQNADDLEKDFIGRLLKIIRIAYQAKYITLIQVKWYYRKSDLPKKFDHILDCISDNEVFETDHLDIIFLDCINGRCKVYSYADYDNLNSISRNTFFTRARYDRARKRLVPPFDSWEKNCICNRPLNPDYLYIQCEICEKWFHINCVGISEKQVDKIDHYQCPNCLKNLSEQQKQVPQPASQATEN